ncbi:MAG: homoaconitate hydratase family protein, partial [Planctomycetes bacterium]|nr:homoaconitate hydratase family protein [Planctomycetota bacterium]
MGKTIIEKIIANHSSEQNIKSGEIVWMDLDVRSARDFGGPNVVKHLQKHFPDNDFVEKENLYFTFDLTVPAKTIAYANNQHLCRQFARETDIALHDVDRGIGSHVLVEEGKILPGFTVVGTDSHFNIMGAVGAFGQGMGDMDIAYAFRYARTWFEVPQSIKVNIVGSVDFTKVEAKDIVLAVIRKLGTLKALGKSVEFYGEIIDELKLHQRITFASMATEMSAISAFLVPNDDVLTYLSEKSGVAKEQIPVIKADADAQYADEITIDLNNLVPQISVPHEPHNVHDVADVVGRRIDSVFIGSCTNGRIEDFAEAAKILRGKKIHKDVSLKMTPATNQ